MKYPGGYQIIDLGGMDIKSEPTEITDKGVLSILASLYDKPSNKPIYISNFAIGGNPHQPVQMMDNLLSTDLMQGFINNVRFISIEYDGDHANIQVNN